MQLHITPTRRILLLWLLAVPSIFITGCFSPGQMQGVPRSGPATDLVIRTQSGTRIIFHEAEWRLNWSGIEGKADIEPLDGRLRVVDTTISYLEVAAVDSRGEDPWTQLLLTILGVILVIGLAGIILYAAFRATER